ncbi:MAG: hypothetical protein R3F18_16240 [Lysobacterales bacterium]
MKSQRANAGNPEDVLLGVVVAGFQFSADQVAGVVAQIVIVRRVPESGFQLGVFLEGVGHVFQEA